VWHIMTDKDTKERELSMAEQMRRLFDEARKKLEAREEFVKITTCPHCGRHDPLPPWLQ
jgi:hypothetical protein